MQNVALYYFVRIVLPIFFFVSLNACSIIREISSNTISNRPANWAQSVEQVGEHQVKNLYKVDDNLYRSAQPKPENTKRLQELGIREVLSLNRSRSVRNSESGFTLHFVPMRASAIYQTDPEMIEALRILRDRKGPLLVHCHYGADRTGTLIAMHRMLNQGWPREEAIAEMRGGGFGFYEGWANVVRYLRAVDIEKTRQLVNGIGSPEEVLTGWSQIENRFSKPLRSQYH